MIIKLSLLIFVFSFIASFTHTSAQNIEVVIKGLRNSKGQIAIGIFRDNPSFQKEEAFISKKFEKRGISSGEMRVCFTLEPGTWGLSLLDDENSNGMMEYNFLGIPKEGFGFSDYYHTGLSRPKFDSFKFTTTPNQSRSIIVRIRYM